MAADAIDENTAVTTQLVEQAKRFDGLALPPIWRGSSCC